MLKEARLRGIEKGELKKKIEEKDDEL